MERKRTRCEEGGGTVLLLLSFALLITKVRCMTCEDARLKCAYREGCGMALRNYLLSCSGLYEGSRTCPEDCQNALIALTSTYEGKHLMTCECDDGYCKEGKQRVEVCRPQVLQATKDETIVSCTVAQWICDADTPCSTALKFYNLHCRSMFAGKRCSSRCENSINILKRQEKAAKLNTCKCDGRESYDCPSIRRNMDDLCFSNKKKSHGFSKHVPPPHHVPPYGGGNIETNEVPSSASTAVCLLQVEVVPLITLLFHYLRSV